MFNSWIFWAVGASLAWGTGQIFIKKSLNGVTPLTYNILVTVVGLLVYLPYAFFLGFDPGNFGAASFLILAFVAATYLFYFYAVSMENISLAGTILATYPAATVFFSIIFLGERLTTNQLFFSLIILLGVVLIGLPEKLRGFKLEKWFVFAVLVSLLVGFADFLAKGVVNQTAMGDYFMLYAMATIPGLLLAYFVDKKGRVWPRLKGKFWLLALMGALGMEVGNVFFFTAFSKGPASLVSPFVSSYQVITVILAIIFLKEKLRKVQALGVALAVLGIILIGAF